MAGGVDIAARVRILVDGWNEQAKVYERHAEECRARGDHSERRRHDIAASFLRSCASDATRALLPGSFIAGSGRRVP